MRKISLLILTLAVIVLAGYIIFLREHEIPTPPGWPANIKLYRNQARGWTRVVDASTGQTLFAYLPEYDNHVHPIRIETLDDHHWRVVLEKPGN